MSDPFYVRLLWWLQWPLTGNPFMLFAQQIGSLGFHGLCKCCIQNRYSEHTSSLRSLVKPCRYFNSLLIF